MLGMKTDAMSLVNGMRLAKGVAEAQTVEVDQIEKIVEIPVEGLETVQEAIDLNEMNPEDVQVKLARSGKADKTHQLRIV